MSLRKIISSELSHFQRLSQKAQALSWSIILYQLAGTFIWMFMMAFMVQKTGKIEAPAVFSLGFYITLPLVFILVAKLLAYFSTRSIAIAGLLGYGLLVLILFFIPSLNLITVFIFGLLYGIPMGLYWSNRTFLFTTEVNNGQRDYVSGFVGSFKSMFSASVPLITGWFITLTPSLGWDKIVSYRLLALLATFIYIAAGLKIKKHGSHTPKITKLWVKNPSKQWKKFRTFVLLGSIQLTLLLALPEALIITYIGNEGVLGTILSGISLIAGLSLYLLGRKKDAANNRAKIVLFALIPLLISSILILISFNYLTIIIYLISMIVFDNFYWFVYFPIFSNLIEQNSVEGIAHSYRFLIDHEIFINLGRVITSLLYLFLIYKFDNTTAISASILLAALSQLGILSLIKKLK